MGEFVEAVYHVHVVCLHVTDVWMSVHASVILHLGGTE